MKKVSLSLVIMLLATSAIATEVINPPAGRIAIVADGNSPDLDDLGGTAVTLALLRAAGLEERLVHYSHSCDIVLKKSINPEAEKERHLMMQLTCDGTARRWGGFSHIEFIDLRIKLVFILQTSCSPPQCNIHLS